MCYSIIGHVCTHIVARGRRRGETRNLRPRLYVVVVVRLPSLSPRSTNRARGPERLPVSARGSKRETDSGTPCSALSLHSHGCNQPTTPTPSQSSSKTTTDAWQTYTTLRSASQNGTSKTKHLTLSTTPEHKTTPNFNLRQRHRQHCPEEFSSRRVRGTPR